MSRPQLDNQVRIGQLKAEPPSEAECQGLLRSGLRRLEDAGREEGPNGTAFPGLPIRIALPGVSMPATHD